jgi:hypothetical protein
VTIACINGWVAGAAIWVASSLCFTAAWIVVKSGDRDQTDDEEGTS